MSWRGVAIPEAPAHALAEQAVPMLQWVALDALAIDGRYQREITAQGWRNIRRIASGFRWSRFSPLLVAPVEGGRFAVIDGQHRAHAAALCGVREVPAMVVLMDLAEQAQAFAAVNGAVTRVTPIQIYKAALAAGEDWAVACDAVVRDAGCTLMTYVPHWPTHKPRHLACVGLVRAHVAAGTGNVVTAVLRGISGSAMGEEVESYGARLLRPFCDAVALSTRYLRADLAGFCDAHDLFALLDRAAAMAAPGENRRGLAGGMIAARLEAFTAEAAA